MKNYSFIRSIIVITLFYAYNLYSQYNIPDTIHLEETVITGTKVEVARKNVPLAVSVITREEIEQSDESNILPILSKQVPGVFVTQRGITGFGVSDGAAGQINIRGLGGSPTTQVLMLIDGHPQFMGMMGHHLPDAYVSSDIEKVEIIRGPASILYGSNAFGGVVNIITKKQHEQGTTINSRIMYGSFNTQKYMLNGGFKRKDLSIYASVNHDKTDGHRDSSDFKLTNAYLKTGYNIINGIQATADVSIAKYESADPGMENSIAGERIDITRGKAAFSLDNNLGLFEGALKIYYNFGEHKITDGWHSNDEMYGIMFYQGIKPFQGNSVTMGYDYMEYGGKGSPIITVIRDETGQIIPGPDGPQFVLSDKNNKWVSTRNHALYLNLRQILFNKITLNSGIRYETNNIYGEEWIPQAGFSYCIKSNSVIKGLISKGYRPPSIRELYLFPPANDNLKPERLTNVEFTWNQKWLNSKIITEITLYNIKGNNLIIMVPSVAPPPPIYRNSGEFNNAGIEFSTSYKIHDNIKVHANYSYTHMKIPLPSTPTHNLFISGNYRIKKLIFDIQIQHITDLYADINGNTQIIEKNYTIVSTKMKYRVTPYLSAFLSGDNLLNTKYYINNGYVMPGINFMTGLNLELKTKN